MSVVQLIEREVKRLDRNRLASFRKWFNRFDSDAWDRQIEKDTRTGKLDKFTDEALASHIFGKTKEL